MIARVVLATAAAVTLLGAANAPEPRPPITGVSHLAVYARDMSKADQFYTHVLGARKGGDPEKSKRRSLLSQ